MINCISVCVTCLEAGQRPKLNQVYTLKLINCSVPPCCPWRLLGVSTLCQMNSGMAKKRRGGKGGGSEWGLWSIRSVTQRITSCQGLAAWPPASAQWPAFTPLPQPPPSPLGQPPYLKSPYLASPAAFPASLNKSFKIWLRSSCS